MKKKLLLSSILVIALCVSLIAGSTFALFTSEQTINVAVTAGNVDVVAEIDETSIQTKSLGLDTAYATYATRTDFENGGAVSFEENTDGSVNYQSLVIERMTPGDSIKFNIDVTNNSDVDMQYRVRMTSNLPTGATDPNGNPVKDLTEALVITVDTPQGKSAVIKETTDAQGNPVYDDEEITDWSGVLEAATDGNGALHSITVTIEFPDGKPEHDNLYKYAKADMTFVIEAVQGNGTVSTQNPYND